jgi:hypothetical protein
VRCRCRRRTVAIPRKLRRDGQVRPATHAGHGAQELPELRGVGIQRGERIKSALRLVLRFTAAQRRGEIAPVGIEPVVRHFENAADVGRLGLVEEQAGFRRVPIDAVVSLQKPEGDQGVEKVARRPRVQAEAVAHRLQIARLFGEFGEERHFDRAQQGIRSPERQTSLKNAIGRKFHG